VANPNQGCNQDGEANFVGETFVSEYYRGDPPFKRAETETVSVEVKSVLPTSDRSNEVE
jgi:type IV secretory pathway TrbF-like protein